MGAKEYLQYGGVKFWNNVPPEEINRFVRSLPSEKKDSLFEVVQILDQEGLITLDRDEVSTIDRGFEQLYQDGTQRLEISHKPR
ncbi:MAG TPA: hypothetical protein GX511_03590 [Firmicutes bacterium]|nr:hypothetical protein [Bacillota bacterium]